jgi:hypothetical protein
VPGMTFSNAAPESCANPNFVEKAEHGGHVRLAGVVFVAHAFLIRVS